MTRVEFVAVAIRLIALTFGVFAFVGLCPVIGVLLTGRLRFELFVSVSSLSVAMAVGWAIPAAYGWRKADELAQFVVGSAAESPAAIGLTVVDLTSLGFAVIGLGTLVPALREVIGEVMWFTLNDSTLDEYWVNLEWRSRFFATLFEGALGTWLLLGSRGLARGVQRLRGVVEEESPDVSATMSSAAEASDA